LYHQLHLATPHPLADPPSPPPTGGSSTNWRVLHQSHQLLGHPPIPPTSGSSTNPTNWRIPPPTGGCLLQLAASTPSKWRIPLPTGYPLQLVTPSNWLTPPTGCLHHLQLAASTPSKWRIPPPTSCLHHLQLADPPATGGCLLQLADVSTPSTWRVEEISSIIPKPDIIYYSRSTYFKVTGRPKPDVVPVPERSLGNW